MTVTTTTDRQYFAGDGSNPVFPFNFRFFDNSQIYVYLIGSDGVITGKTLNVDYTLTGAMSPTGGQVTFLTPPPLGVAPYQSNVLIQRIVAATQPTSIRNQGAFFPAIHEDTFDRLTMLIQQALYGVSNGLQIDPTGMYWDFKNRRGINAADPIADQDVVNRRWTIDFVESVSGAINNTTGIIYDGGTLYDYLKTGLFRSVPTMAALKLLDPARNQRAFVTDYYAGVKGGGDPWIYDPTDTVTADNGGTVVIGLANSRWKRVQTRPLTFQDFGADTTGTAFCDTAMGNYATFSSNLIFTPGQYRLNASNTIGSTKNVRMEQGASFFCTASGVIAIYGGFTYSGFSQIFFGPGLAVGLREVWPEWFGAKGDGIADDQPALQAAHQCLQYSMQFGGKGGRPTLYLQPAIYQLNNTFSIRPSAAFNIAVIGAGSAGSGVGAIGTTRIRASTTFPAAPLINIEGPSVVADQTADFIIKDFRVPTNPVSNGACTTGIRVGIPLNSNRLEGWHCSLIENICIYNYPVCWDVVHTRLVNFNRISGWNDFIAGGSTALLIRTAGNFTGDLRFNNCQFVSNVSTGTSSVKIQANSGVSTGAPNNMVAGIKFSECDFYQADKKVIIQAGNGSWIADIWFDNCQWDGSSNQDLYVETTTAGTKIDDVHFSNCYMAGGNLTAAFDQITFNNSGGSIVDISFNGGSLQLAQGRTMLINGVNGMILNSVTIRDNNNQIGAAIEAVNSFRLVVDANKMNRVASNFSRYFLSLGAGLNYVMATGNIGAGIVSISTINDASGAISKVVANNL